MTDFNIHSSISQHLKKLGLTTQKECYNFLYPKLSDLPSPSGMKDIEKAVDLIINSICKGNDIIIWGDYDVDGVTATALLILFFKELGIPVLHHIPDRLTEGYGLNINKIKEFWNKSDKEKLLITVDCGITNHEEVSIAKQIGFKVIVTDHHTPPKIPVSADAILNPKQKDCNFPFKHLAGVGVAFYFALSIRKTLWDNNIKSVISGICKPNMKRFLGLVSLGTIADVMPLKDTNRVMVKGGFEAINSDQCLPSLKSLFDETGIDRKVISSELVSFNLAPLINSAGRMGEPSVALDCLISEKRNKHTKRLTSLNAKRKKISARELDSALVIARKHLFLRSSSLVVKGDFSDGILGITAARLVEIFNVPAIVLCNDAQKNNILKGSARAPRGFDLYKALEDCSRFLIRYGGHKAAAGLLIDETNLELFSNSFDDVSSNEYANYEKNNNTAESDCIELNVSEALNTDLTTYIYQLEPLGEANPRPLFVDYKSYFVSKKYFGKNGNHLRGVLRGKYGNIPIIGFNIADKAQKIEPREASTILYTHMLDSYNNSNSWKLRVRDIWPYRQH